MIEFTALREDHFQLLITWLQTPHVAQWWAQGEVWDTQAVSEKYNSYVQGYKINEHGIKKNIDAFIIVYEQQPIGYIQFYNVYDFSRDIAFEEIRKKLPAECAALDIFIGDLSCTGKGIGVLAIKEFLEQHVFKKFSACYVDPEKNNAAAIRAYEKAGFSQCAQSDCVVPMIKLPV